MPTQKLHPVGRLLFCIVLSALSSSITNAQPRFFHTITHRVKMEESKNSVNREGEEKNPIIVFFTNLLAGIKLPFLQEKNGAVSEPAVAISKVEEPVKIDTSVVEDEKSTAITVTFPKQSFAPVKLEAEADEGQRSTNPILLWQVYAIGGFLVLRWGWNRWNERKGKKKSDDEPPPTQD